MAKGTREPERMEPLSAAKIEIMAAKLTAAAPGAPKIRRIISAATRSVDGHGAGGKHIKIGQIGQQINRDHRQRADNQRQRQVALRLSHFGRHHRDVIPAVVGPQGRPPAPRRSPKFRRALAWMSDNWPRCRARIPIRSQ